VKRTITGLAVGLLTLGVAAGCASQQPTAASRVPSGCVNCVASIPPNTEAPLPLPSPTLPPAPVVPAAPVVPTIDDGTWTVGTDFPAGKYRTTGVAGADCYWEIAKSGTNGSDIVDNHIGAGHLTVTLKVGQDFDTERCGTWAKIG
jgi:hypothetical protein